MTEPGDIRALQISFSIPSLLLLILKLVLLGHFFIKPFCSDYLFTGICVGYVV